MNTITPRTTPASEDCLFLNVFAPSGGLSDTATALPVMLWIHGGAYTTGESNDYHGDSLVTASNNSVIVVTINYRLAQFGFLASPELQKRSTDGSVGNWGIQDQRLAIAWVKDHIAAFGGDGNAITIFGESAGGNSVINHLAAPASAGLFRAAVVESGAYDEGAASVEAAAVEYRNLLAKVHCDTVECLEKVSTEDLIAAVTPLWLWGPTIDGKAMPEAPTDLIAKGKYNSDVHVMIGSNRDEMAFFNILYEVPTQLTEAEFETRLRSSTWGFNASQVSELKQLYAPGGDYPYPATLGYYSPWWWAYTRVGTDVVPGLGPCAVRWLAELLVAGGTPSVHAYFFAEPTACDAASHPADCAALETSIPGIVSSRPVVVPHAVEIQYVYGYTDLMPAGEQVDLANIAVQYWAAFGRTGSDPSVVGLPPWSQYAVGQDNVLRFEAASHGGVRAEVHTRKAACDFMLSQKKA